MIVLSPTSALALSCVYGESYDRDEEYIDSVFAGVEEAADVDLSIGSVFILVRAGKGSFFIGTTSGLHHASVPVQRVYAGEEYKARMLTSFSGQPGSVYAISDQQNGVRWVGASNGLYRFDGTQLTPVEDQVSEDLGAVFSISNERNGVRLIGAENGLFELRGSILTPHKNNAFLQWPDGAALAVHAISEASQGVQLLGTKRALFRLEEDGTINEVEFLPTYGAPLHPGAVLSFATFDPGHWLVGTERGLFETGIEDGYYFYRRFPQLSKIEGVRAIARAREDVWLIGAEDGIYRFDLSELDRLDELRSSVFRAIPETQRFRVNALAPLEGGDWLIGSSRSDTLWGDGFGRLKLRPETEVELSSVTQSGRLRFEIDGTGRCAEHIDQSDFMLIDSVGEVLETEFPSLNQNGTLQISLKNPPPPGSSISVRLATTDATGAVAPLSEPVTVAAPWTIRETLEIAGSLMMLLHTLFYAALLFFANRSDRVAGLLLNPIFNRMGLWWALLITYSPAVQRWLLERWFHKRQRVVKGSDLLPLELSGPDGASLSSAELAKALKVDKRLWLQGNPGMGKSALVQSVEAQFFSNRSLADGFTAFGYIPLVVSLRSISNPGKGDRHWLARVAETALSRDGFLPDENTPDQNLTLVEAFVRRCGLILILDGANEVPWKDEIEKAAGATRAPGLLVTSQAHFSDNDQLFDLWTLPASMNASISPLLKLFLGEEVGSALYEQIAGTPLIDEIRSGFEVRLLESLHRSGVAHFPEDRLGLYLMIAEKAFDSDRRLAQMGYAFAWKLWLENRREFADGEVAKALLNRISASDLSMTRMVDGTHREFRHDQMRGYLAAMHVITSANPIGTLEADEKDWPRASSEQDVVFGFLAALADDPLAQRIYQWSLEKPENRIRVQVAFAQALSTKSNAFL